MEADNFRGSITRLQHPPPTLPDSAFPARARLASGCLASSAGRDSASRLHPLGSFRKFQLSVSFLFRWQPPFALSFSWRDVNLVVNSTASVHDKDGRCRSGSGFAFQEAAQRFKIHSPPAQSYVTIQVHTGAGAVRLDRSIHADGIQRIGRAEIAVACAQSDLLVSVFVSPAERALALPVPDVAADLRAIRREWEPALVT
jgi:hypothetical protein